MPQGLPLSLRRLKLLTPGPDLHAFKDVKGIMGLASYGRFTAGFADIAAPLQQFTCRRRLQSYGQRRLRMRSEGQVVRWLETLEGYNFTVEHPPGSKHALAADTALT